MEGKSAIHGPIFHGYVEVPEGSEGIWKSKPDLENPEKNISKTENMWKTPEKSRNGSSIMTFSAVQGRFKEPANQGIFQPGSQKDKQLFSKCT